MSEFFQIDETNDRYLVVYQIEEIEEYKTNATQSYYITLCKIFRFNKEENWFLEIHKFLVDITINEK